MVEAGLFAHPAKSNKKLAIANSLGGINLQLSYEDA